MTGVENLLLRPAERSGASPDFDQWRLTGACPHCGGPIFAKPFPGSSPWVHFGCKCRDAIHGCGWGAGLFFASVMWAAVALIVAGWWKFN